MSDDRHGDEQPTDPVTGAPVPPAWPPADDQPTLVTPTETAPVERRPTSVDPLLPPPPPVVPSWSSPSPAGPQYAAPSWEAPAGPPPAAPSVAGAPRPPSAPPPPSPVPPYAGPQDAVPAFGSPQYGVPSGVGLPGTAGWGAVPVAPKPGVVPLRPLGLGEILDGAVSYIRRDPKTVLGISAVISLVIAVVQFLALEATKSSFSAGLTGSAADQIAASLGSVSASLVQYTVSAVLGVLATGLLTVVMGQAVLGRRVTASEAWSRTRPRFWALLGLTVLVSVGEGAVLVAGILIAVGVGYVAGQAAVGVGILVGVLLGLGAIALFAWVYVRLLLAPVALILEKAGITTSVRRSWGLVSGAWWRTFGIYLLGSILAAIVSSVLAIPFGVAGAVASFSAIENGQLPLTYTVSTSLATLVSSTVVLPFTSGVVALLYIDRRIRREALDIELARAAGVSG